MKLSISLPDVVAREIKTLSQHTERNVSWWIQKAWMLARTQLLRGDQDESRKKALKKMKVLRGALKESFPNIDSVNLARSAFRGKH